MNILVLNCGSSSVKFQLFDMAIDPGGTAPREKRLAKGVIERIGDKESSITFRGEGKEPYKHNVPVKEHKDAIIKVVELLTDQQYGVLSKREDIKAVGHRMVHGGENFSESKLINEEVHNQLVECIELAPLHNPHNIKGYEISKELLPGIPHVAVFDTAFHQTMPPHSFVYPLPYELYSKHKIRRYGFHGTSHRYNLYRASRLLDIPTEKLNLITCHLGNGVSITAIKNGQSVDTSMGFTPLEGLVMGTRTGDIDPAIVFYIADSHHLDMDIDEINNMMNKKSGLLGISGLSNDMRELEEAAGNGDKRAELAIDIFCYRIKKYIGAYAAALGKVNAITFTAGIGENSPLIRKKACDGLEFFGIDLDPDLNEGGNVKEGIISKPSSRVKILIIRTNEELLIARDTIVCVAGAKGPE